MAYRTVFVVVGEVKDRPKNTHTQAEGRQADKHRAGGGRVDKHGDKQRPDKPINTNRDKQRANKRTNTKRSRGRRSGQNAEMGRGVIDTIDNSIDILWFCLFTIFTNLVMYFVKTNGAKLIARTIRSTFVTDHKYVT